MKVIVVESFKSNPWANSIKRSVFGFQNNQEIILEEETKNKLLDYLKDIVCDDIRFEYHQNKQIISYFYKNVEMRSLCSKPLKQK